jgi:cytochrome c
MAINRTWIAGVAASALMLAAGGVGAQPPGDPAKGAAVFDDHCSDCHVLEGVGQGPSLIGVVARKAGSLAGYGYTAALTASGLTWTPANLDRFLAGPKTLVPGTAMSETVVDPTQRRDLIAYLATLQPKR